MSLKRIKDYTFKYFINTITLFGTPTFYLIVILFLLNFNIYFSLKLLIFLVLLELTAGFIKFSYPKKRPNSKDYFDFISLYESRSFPSIHTARITLLIFTLLEIYDNFYLRIVSFLLIFSVAYSRVNLKEHYAIDVIGGFILGLLFYGLSLVIW
jgi:membrane-associated phospholipid phosphatase